MKRKKKYANVFVVFTQNISKSFLVDMYFSFLEILTKPLHIYYLRQMAKANDISAVIGGMHVTLTTGATINANASFPQKPRR